MEAIKTAMSKTEPVEVKKFFKSMNNILLVVIEKKAHKIMM